MIRKILEEKNKDRLDLSKYWYPNVSYEDAFVNLKILLWKAVGDYQGDYFVLLQDPVTEKIGFITVAFGSCTGCDQLEWLCSTSWNEKDTLENRSSLLEHIVVYLQSLRDSVYWEDNKDTMKKYLSNKADKEMLSSYMIDDEREEVWKELFDALT